VMLLMPSASEHTILINSIIAMFSPNHPWPSPLYDMGLRLLSVEEVFNVGTVGRRSCNPDVISVKSDENIVVLLECKGGKNIDENQLETYVSVTPADIDQLMTVNDPRKTSINIVYVARVASTLEKSIFLALNSIRKKKTVTRVPEQIDIIELTNQTIRVHTTHETEWLPAMIDGIPISDVLLSVLRR
jgi:hypothetical protein